jgi:hypothetical protein
MLPVLYERYAGRYCHVGINQYTRPFVIDEAIKLDLYARRIGRRKPDSYRAIEFALTGDTLSQP